MTFYRSIFCFFGIGVDICKKDYIGKNQEYNLGLSIINGDKRANNPTIDIADIAGKANNLGRNTHIIDVDRIVDNLYKNIGIADVNKEAGNLGISKKKADGRVYDLGIGIRKTDRRANNSGIGIGKANRRADDPRHKNSRCGQSQ